MINLIKHIRAPISDFLFIPSKGQNLYHKALRQNLIRFLVPIIKAEEKTVGTMSLKNGSSLLSKTNFTQTW